MDGQLTVDVSNHEVCEGTKLPTNCSLMKILFWWYTIVSTNLPVGQD